MPIQPLHQHERQYHQFLQCLWPRKRQKLFPSRKARIKELTIPMKLYWLAPQAGEYISPKRKLILFPGAAPNSLPLNCYNQCFGLKEAKKGSVAGKGEKLLQLDPNLRQHTERMFPNEFNWPVIKKALDEKCRMVPNNNRIFGQG